MQEMQFRREAIGLLREIAGTLRRIEKTEHKIMVGQKDVLEDIAAIGTAVAVALAAKFDEYTNATAAAVEAKLAEARAAWDKMRAAEDEQTKAAAQAEWAQAHEAAQAVLDKIKGNQPVLPPTGDAVPSPADPAVAQSVADGKVDEHNEVGGEAGAATETKTD